MLVNVGVASSSLVFRSLGQQLAVFFVFIRFVEFLVAHLQSLGEQSINVLIYNYFNSFEIISARFVCKQVYPH